MITKETYSKAGPASAAARAQTRDTRAMRRSWAQVSKRIYQVDPLVYPLCDSEMKVIAIITEPAAVDAILRHLATAEAESRRGPPGAAARCVDHMDGVADSQISADGLPADSAAFRPQRLRR
jgi:hypothetical protein